MDYITRDELDQILVSHRRSILKDVINLLLVRIKRASWKTYV